MYTCSSVYATCLLMRLVAYNCVTQPCACKNYSLYRKTVKHGALLDYHWISGFWSVCSKQDYCEVANPKHGCGHSYSCSTFVSMLQEMETASALCMLLRTLPYPLFVLSKSQNLPFLYSYIEAKYVISLFLLNELCAIRAHTCSKWGFSHDCLSNLLCIYSNQTHALLSVKGLVSNFVVFYLG